MEIKPQLYKFPKDFFWGAVTAAHQVEGNTNNAWTEWEKNTSEHRAKTAREDYLKQIDFIGEFREELWEEVKDIAADPNNYISGKTSEHYTRYPEDLKLAKSLNLNSYRFSIEWSRIEPEQGKYDEKEIQHYREFIQAVKENGMEPFVTIWHFTLPKWFQDLGGFEKKENLPFFYAYVNKLLDAFGDIVNYWIVMNEPMVWIAASYVAGDWPPNQKAGLKSFKIQKILAEVQKQSYMIIKSRFPNVQVGISQHTISFDVHWYSIAKPLGLYIDRLFNYSFIKKTHKYMDFLGLNYYVRSTFGVRSGLRGLKLLVTGRYDDLAKSSRRGKNKDIIGLSDMGWELYPKGLYTQVKSYWKKFKKPIIITEHGLADREDKHRKSYMGISLMYLHKAMEEGVDVRGYLHWSLIDNFEWDKGYWPRFGLIEVNYKDQSRTIRESAKWYGNMIKNGGFDYQDIFDKDA